jgi:hypothetical protein
MNRKTLLTTIVFLSLFAACKKNNDSPAPAGGGGSNTDTTHNGSGGGPSGPTYLKLKMYVEETHSSGINRVDTFYVNYDDQGRLTGLVGTTLKFVYTYNGNISLTQDILQNGNLNIHAAYFLKGSMIDSTWQYNNTHDTSIDKYTYTNGLMTADMYYHFTTARGSWLWTRTDYAYDDSSNMTKIVETDSIGRVNSTILYTYTNKPLLARTTPASFPMVSRNLPATAKYLDNLGNVDANITYTYEFDSSGRMTKQTATDVSGLVAVKDYYY